jgi:PAS domain S-box-containing protein
MARREARRLAAMEGALAEATERFRSLFDYHPNAVFAIDLHGRFVSTNPGCSRLSGYSADELRRMDRFSQIAPTAERQLRQEVFEGAMNRRSGEIVGSITHKDGHAVEVHATTVPVVVGDEVVGIYAIVKDVTEELRLQRERDSALRQAEQANEMKSLFLANMSHEIRTPLTSLIGTTELLLDCDLGGQETKFAQTIDRSNQRLLRVVNDILDFSKLEAGETQLEVCEYDLRALLADIVTPVEDGARGKGLEFDCTVDPALPDSVMGDQGRLYQVLTNLLENAVKFTDSGSVRLDVQPATTPSGTDTVRFSVSDTGIGLTNDQLGRIFQSFSQADPSITRRFGGTGLGLAICKDLVTLMGGSIWADSTEDAGSTFTFELPLRPRRPAGDKAAADGGGDHTQRSEISKLR